MSSSQRANSVILLSSEYIYNHWILINLSLIINMINIIQDAEGFE